MNGGERSDTNAGYNKKLEKFYDALCGVLRFKDFFSNVNNIEESSHERDELDRLISDFEYFSKYYGIIKKGTAYFIVQDKEFNGKFIESLETIDQSMIVTCITEQELMIFQYKINDLHGDIKKAIADLINKKD